MIKICILKWLKPDYKLNVLNCCHIKQCWWYSCLTNQAVWSVFPFEHGLISRHIWLQVYYTLIRHILLLQVCLDSCIMRVWMTAVVICWVLKRFKWLGHSNECFNMVRKVSFNIKSLHFTYKSTIMMQWCYSLVIMW